ncbi:MAG TPA: hypothetical protein VKP61_00305 [Candidatus Acidoferrum sp.]|nr:hypothetical protein [Candidatus Acidoferrum sp.]
MHRKDYALALFRLGLAPRILMSVGRFEIRRFFRMPLPVPLDLLGLAQEVPPPRRHYFVFFHGREVRAERVQPRRFGTLTEIDALARWLDAHPEIRSLLIVSSDTHLRRLRLCCRSLLRPGIELAFIAARPSLPAPAESVSSEGNEGIGQAEDKYAFASTLADLLELFKLSIYWFLLKIR